MTAWTKKHPLPLPGPALLLAALLFYVCGLVFAGAGPGWAASPPASAPYTLSPAFYHATGPDAPPETDCVLALTFTPQPGYYIYAGPSQATGRPTTVSVVDSENRAVTPYILYPQGVEREDAFSPGEKNRVYPGPVTLAVPLRASRYAGQTLTARYSGLLCSATNCTPFALALRPAVPDREALARLPQAAAQPWWPAVTAGPREKNTAPTVALSPTAENSGERARPALSLRGPGSAQPPAPSPFFQTLTPRFFASSLEVTSLAKALMLGFFAGLLLNIMPCVLPVLGLKLASLLAGSDAESAENRRRFFVRHQIFFALGILFWFAVLAGLLAGLGLVWGQLFQSTGLILGLAVMLLLLACNLFGVFSLPILDIKGGPSSRPDLSAFINGATATLLATPCSGPLLGGVLSWALLQPLPILALALLSVGLGMASPYLLLAARPELARYMPRPGPWMGVVEQLLGFLLLAAAAYLLTLLPAQRLPRALIALVLAAFAAWLWGQAGGVHAGKTQRLFARTFAAGLLLFACLWPLGTTASPFVWQQFEQERFNAEFGKKALLVEFTADWCPTCKLMEATTLTPNRLAGWQKRHNFTAVRVDLTHDNPEGQDLLRRLGSASIPMLALFPAGENAASPLVLRDVVTAGQLDEALDQAFGGR